MIVDEWSSVQLVRSVTRTHYRLVRTHRGVEVHEQASTGVDHRILEDVVFELENIDLDGGLRGLIEACGRYTIEEIKMLLDFFESIMQR